MRFKGSGCSIDTEYSGYNSSIVVDIDDVSEIGTIDEVIEFYGKGDILDEIGVDSILEHFPISTLLEHFKLEDVIGLEDELMGHIVDHMGESWIIDRLSESSFIQIQREFKIDNI